MSGEKYNCSSTPGSSSFETAKSRQSSLREFRHEDRPPWRDEELLRDLYQQQGLSTYDIADRLDCYPGTVQKWLHEFNIPVRGPRGSPIDAKYKKKDWLREQYIQKQLPAHEIAEQLGVSNNTIYSWLDRFGISRRPAASEIPEEAPYVDSSWLREKYCEKGLSTREIAKIAEVHPNTILTWLHRHEIPVEEPGRNALPYASYFISSAGYPSWRSYVRETESEEQVAVHRLLMAASHDLSEIAGKQVHHQNGIPWDNRPDNLELKTPAEHGKYHANLQDHERDNRGRFK